MCRGVCCPVRSIQRATATTAAPPSRLLHPLRPAAPPPAARRMCGSLCMRPARTESGIQRRIAALILLHEALAVLPALAETLQGARCELLQARAGGMPVRDP